MTACAYRLAGLLATGLLLVLAAASCEDRQAEAAPAVNIGALISGPQLNGNDSRAWLSRSGGASDTNYCDASLRLPLEQEPAWQWSYSPGGFSPNSVSSVNHYDGRIYLTAYYSSLACLDADDGREIFNVYLNSGNSSKAIPSTRGRRNSIPYNSVFLHPAGRIILMTSFRGDQALFDISSEPNLIWKGGEDEIQASGFLLSEDSMFVGREDSMLACSLDGSPRWELPMFSVPVGNVLSDSGLLISYNDGRNLWACRESDGALQWSLTDSQEITSVAVDNAMDCVYVSFHDERVDALELRDGSLRWSHDFSGLLDARSRERIMSGAVERYRGMGFRPPDRLALENVAMSVTPAGLVMAVDFGFVFALDHGGQLLWQRTDLASIANITAFNNALLVQEYWYPPELASQQLLGWRSPLTMGDRPDWENIASQGDELDLRIAEFNTAMSQGQEAQEQYWAQQRQMNRESEPLQVLFASLELLDPASGESLGGFELPHLVNCGFCPAGDKLVFEASGFRVSWHNTNAPGAADRSVLAYNWLEPGGDT